MEMCEGHTQVQCGRTTQQTDQSTVSLKLAYCITAEAEAGLVSNVAIPQQNQLDPTQGVWETETGKSVCSCHWLPQIEDTTKKSVTVNGHVARREK